jgi:hypothetical protein
LTNSGTNLILGAWNSSQEYQGYMMHCAVYNAVLSSTDILSHYTLGGGTLPSAATFIDYIPGPTVIGF